MSKNWKTIPNQLSLARIALTAAMWPLALLKLPVHVGILLIITYMTDVIDGWVARRLGQVSELGSRLDSLADNLLLPSALVWLWILRPEIYRDNAVICLIGMALYFLSLAIGAIKFHRFANLHLHSSRAGSVILVLFAAHALIADHYSSTLFYAAVVMFIVSSAETLLLQSICSQVNEHMGSILFVFKDRKMG